MTMKQKGLAALSVVLALLALSGLCLGLYAMSSDGFHTGRCIVSDGGLLFIDEDGSPIELSDASADGKLFEGLQTGDKIRVYYEVVAESYPGQASTDYCLRLEGGRLEDIPAETRQRLEELGWLDTETVSCASETVTCSIAHGLAPVAQTVDDPVTGYCGNIMATVTRGGETATFSFDDAVTLTDILINLDYDPAAVCNCVGEITANVEYDPSGYTIDLTHAHIRCASGQCALTAGQVATIRDIVQRQLG